MRQRRDVGGQWVDADPMDALVARLSARMATGGARPHHHVSLNATKWDAMRRDAGLRGIVRAADSVGPDGAAVAWATGLPRLPGIDLAERLLGVAAREGRPVALIGGTPAVVGVVRDRLAARGVPVVLARDGFFGPEAEAEVAARIEAAAPALALLALGSPKAERFVGRWAPGWRRVGVVMGVGGAFDVWAGAARRAPAWVGRAGLEWAWRFLGAPRARFSRAVVGPARFVGHRLAGTRLPVP